MPAPHMTDPTTRPFAAPTAELCLSYATDDQHDASRPNCGKRTQSQTAVLAGNTPLRPDYRTAARSGFVPSAAPAPPPKASFRSSPPPRSARLASTIPLDHYASPRPKPAPSKTTGMYTFPLGVHKLTTSAHSLSGNSGVERVYITMAKILAMVCNEHQHNWDAHRSPRCTPTYDKRLLPAW